MDIIGISIDNKHHCFPDVYAMFDVRDVFIVVTADLGTHRNIRITAVLYGARATNVHILSKTVRN